MLRVGNGGSSWARSPGGDWCRHDWHDWQYLVNTQERPPVAFLCGVKKRLPVRKLLTMFTAGIRYVWVCLANSWVFSKADFQARGLWFLLEENEFQGKIARHDRRSQWYILPDFGRKENSVPKQVCCLDSLLCPTLDPGKVARQKDRLKLERLSWEAH